MESYRLVLGEAAGMSFAKASRTAQRRLIPILDVVKATPFRRGDLQESGVDGREHQVLVFGDWVVTYWSDHAVREVRIVRLERVDH